MSELPAFEVVRRVRPVALLAPEHAALDVTEPGPVSDTACAQLAPATTVQADLPPARAERVELVITSGTDRLACWLDPDGRAGLSVTAAGTTKEHRSRRRGRVSGAVHRLALTLTGMHLTVFVQQPGGEWVAVGRTDLSDRVDPRREDWLAGVAVGHLGSVLRLRAGAFGQLGLRDLRLVSHPDGSPVWHDGQVLLAATSAGPGFFDTAHTSVWSLDPASLDLTHRSDLFFRRPDRPGVFNDHATHLLQVTSHGTEPTWLVATSTWGDFDASLADASVEVTLARTGADLLHGRHLLDTEPLPLPTTGLTSVGVWDPHLAQIEDGTWLVGYVSARRFFRFHPVVAEGPSLDRLTLRAAAADRRATEGTTLARIGERWQVLASDGRDGRRGQRAAYPVFDLDLAQVGTIDANYPTNLPWPTVIRVSDTGRARDWLMVGFDGSAHGGSLLGYGTHGTVVIARGVERDG